MLKVLDLIMTLPVLGSIVFIWVVWRFHELIFYVLTKIDPKDFLPGARNRGAAREGEMAVAADPHLPKAEFLDIKEKFHDASREEQFQLGMMYYFGNDDYGIKEDKRKAANWLRLAADQKLSCAQNNLGVMYEKGEGGLKQNYKMAAELYRLASEQNYSTAHNNLGVMYSNGLGVDKDYTKAKELFYQAAYQGVEFAQYNLGQAYHNGEGVPQSYKEAYIWYTLAAAKGHKEAEKFRDNLADSLSHDDLLSAQREAVDRYKNIQSNT